MKCLEEMRIIRFKCTACMQQLLGKNGKTVFAHACSCNIFPKIIFENRSTWSLSKMKKLVNLIWRNFSQILKNLNVCFQPFPSAIKHAQICDKKFHFLFISIWYDKLSKIIQYHFYKSINLLNSYMYHTLPFSLQTSLHCCWCFSKHSGHADDKRN